MTDVECYNGRMLIVSSAGCDWLGKKDVMKQHSEYENGQQSHKNTILKKESTVNAKVGLVETNKKRTGET